MRVWLGRVQKVIERLRVLSRRQLPPAPALIVAVACGVIAASLLTLTLEWLLTVYWWTALLYMAVFFAVSVLTYKRISPKGAAIATHGGRRYLEDSGTLDVLDAARTIVREARSERQARHREPVAH